jgi:hypothetical protein
MKVKECSDGSLVLEGNILEGAQEAFKNKRYVEAFALLHADIDWWMTALIQSHGVAKALTIDQRQKLFSDSEYRFKNSVHFLEEHKIIDEKERGRLLRFNELRDRVIHRLVTYSYHTHAENRITKLEVTKGFEDGKVLDCLLRSKNSEVIRGEKQAWNP